MVTSILQDKFAAQPFQGSQLNLHRHNGENARPLVVLVHGLNGSAETTWGSTPRFLFDHKERLIDVALFDYPSGMRRRKEKGVEPTLAVKLLTGYLRDLEKTYRDIYMVGHSLGGLIVEEVAMRYLTERSLREQSRPGALAAMVYVGSPRAGSLWAPPVLNRVLPETEFLEPLSARDADVQAFYKTHIEPRHDVVPQGGQIGLPLYAAVAGSDALVREFSAALGVPTEQVRYLVGGHADVTKPEDASGDFIGWLLDDVLAEQPLRIQERRVVQNTAQTVEEDSRPRGVELVTKFFTDRQGLMYSSAYAEVAGAMADRGISVIDSSVTSREPGLLMGCHSATLISKVDEATKSLVEELCDDYVRHAPASAGIFAVGNPTVGEAALSTMATWITARVPSSGIYTHKVENGEELRTAMATLIDLVLRGDPMRRPSRFGEAAASRLSPPSRFASIGGY